MSQPIEDLTLITDKTLEHYNERAVEFWNGTRDHDVKQNIEALLRHMRGVSPLRILDFGCGPGRDLTVFRALGHEPIGLEGSQQFATM
ncbi:MAG: SAM-dependent methyltransferase, partial [Methylophilus sp.]